MLRLPKFKYVAPDSLQEVSRILAAEGKDAMIVAGGTDIYPKMKRRQFVPKTLLGLRQFPELSEIRGDASSGLVIGASASLTAVSDHPAIFESYQGLSKATGAVSTPILRNMGTLGGNLCLDTRCNYYDQTHHWREGIGWCMKAPSEKGWPVIGEVSDNSTGIPCRVAPGSPRCWAVSSTDSAPMLMALGAKVRMTGASGEREISVGELYRDDGMFYLSKSHDEVLTEIALPAADGIKSTYWKLRRRESFDFPVLGVAVALKQSGDGTIEHAKIVIGGVGSRPFEMTEAENLLIGQKPVDEVLEAVGDAVFKPARPLDNTDYHLFYRKRMAPVYVKRAIRELIA